VGLILKSGDSQNRPSRPRSSSEGVSSRLGKPSIASREGGRLSELPGTTDGLSGLTDMTRSDAKALVFTVIVVPP
jgi:hypothetical protein